MGQQAKEDKHAAKDEGQSPKVPSAAPPPAPPVEDDATTRRASKAAAQAAFLHRLGSRLWKVGVLLRMLTLLNGVAVLFAVSYAIWRDVIPESHNDAAFDWPLMSRLNDGVPPEVSSYLPHNATLRNALRFGTAAAVGLAMIVLEMCTAVAEAATRSAIGLAFGATGRFWLFCVFALLCAPMVRMLLNRAQRQGRKREGSRHQHLPAANRQAFPACRPVLFLSPNGPCSYFSRATFGRSGLGG